MITILKGQVFIALQGIARGEAALGIEKKKRLCITRTLAHQKRTVGKAPVEGTEKATASTPRNRAYNRTIFPSTRVFFNSEKKEWE